LNGHLLSEQTGEGGRVSIAREALQFRTVLLRDSRSATLAKLFDYLLERANDARAPKEIEVAIAVFGKNGTFDTSENSTVRAHMHRLRQRLDKFNAGKSGPRLTIPKGEYRLILSEAPAHDGGEELQPSTPASPLKRIATRQAVAIVLGANLLLWSVLFLFGDNGRPSPPLAQTALWRPIIAAERSPVVAVGDFFLVGKSGEDGMIERLAMKPAIRSGPDIADYELAHPEQRGKLHDRDIYRVPAREAKSAMEILNLVSTMRPRTDVAGIVPVSRISQDRIDSSNIIYIQYFSQLGALRSPIVHLSGFAPTADFDTIRDVASGRLYRARVSSGEAAPAGGGGPADSYGYDYGYLASFPGSSGNRNILISGINDAGLSQMVKLVSNKQQLDSLSQRTGGGSAFEALYQVRTVGGLAYDTKLLIARPLRTDVAGNPAR
jgi:hypothetical protein